MNEFERVLEAKQAYRRRLANLSFGEKVALVEQMRDRSRLIARSSLRKQQKEPLRIRAVDGKGVSG